MPFFLNCVILKLPGADNTPSEEAADAPEPATSSATITSSRSRDALVLSTDNEEAEAVEKELQSRLEQRFAAVGAQVELEHVLCMAGLVTLLVTVVSVDTTKFAEHMRGRKTAMAATALKFVFGTKVEEFQKSRAEKKLGKIVAKELAGPSETLPVTLAPVWRDIDYEDAWLLHMTDCIEKGTVPWAMDPQCRVLQAWDDGSYRLQAQKAGLLRPWMLLASMSPEARHQIGKSLGVKDLGKEKHGAAVEAWEILAQGRKGIGPRIDYTLETLERSLVNADRDLPPWPQVLLRVLSAVHADVPKQCQSLDTDYKAALLEANQPGFDGEQITTVGSLERCVLETVQQKWVSKLPDEDRVAVEQAAAESDHDLLNEAGLAGLERLAVMIATGDSEGQAPLVNHAVEKLKNLGKKQLVRHAVKWVVPGLAIPSMVVCIGTSVFGSDSLGCEIAIVEIMLQRLRLVAEGFDVDGLLNVA